MDDQACPRCKTTKYRNPSLKLMVNVCGHALCDSCVELLFVKGSGSCVECGIALRRNNFRLQLFEDATVEKEVDIRKRILKDFNKKEEDFATLRQFNDYLEQVETIIFNLTNNIDVETTKLSIDQYKRENKAFIVKNKTKLSREEEYLEDMIEVEKREKVQRSKQILQEEKEEKTMKIKNKNKLIDDLMFSDVPVGQILATHNENVMRLEKASKPPSTQFSTGIKFRQKSFLPIPAVQESLLYVYETSVTDFNGPPHPELEAIVTDGYLDHIRSANGSEEAGGFLSQIACLRAMQESNSDLFLNC